MKTTIQERGRYLGIREGYRVEKSAAAEIVFVRKPSGTRYAVNLRRETCSCPATVPVCCHIVFARRMTAKRRACFSARHIQRLRQAGYPPASLSKDDTKLTALVLAAKEAHTECEVLYSLDKWDEGRNHEDVYEYRLRQVEKYLGAEACVVRAAIEGHVGGSAVVARVLEVAN